jgi:hypothetical protein
MTTKINLDDLRKRLESKPKPVEVVKSQEKPSVYLDITNNIDGQVRQVFANLP